MLEMAPKIAGSNVFSINMLTACELRKPVARVGIAGVDGRVLCDTYLFSPLVIAVADLRASFRRDRVDLHCFGVVGPRRLTSGSQELLRGMCEARTSEVGHYVLCAASPPTLEVLEVARFFQTGDFLSCTNRHDDCGDTS